MVPTLIELKSSPSSMLGKDTAETSLTYRINHAGSMQFSKSNLQGKIKMTPSYV